jgi:hypothetical protein
MGFGFRKKKRKVYLGTVGVVPRDDLKRHIEELTAEGMDAALRSHLEEVLSLPKAPPPDQATAEDLALDMFLAKHQIGEFSEFFAGDLCLPLVWRPKVKLSSRLYAVRTGKPVRSFHVTKRLAWVTYFGRVFSLRGIFGTGASFTAADMTALIDEALIELLTQVRRHT